jgi:lysophospholipase L1-like esterase
MMVTPPTPLHQLHHEGWKARHEAKLLEARAGAFDLVLLGDSITEAYEWAGPEPWRDYRGVWQRYYADRRALNLGFAGDGTRHLLWRILHGEIDGLAPKLAMLLIGTNDIGWLDGSAAETVAGIEAVLAALRQRLPDAQILLVGVLPSDRGAVIAAATADINAALAARYGDGRVASVIYADIGPVFLQDGVLDRRWFADPLQDPPGPALHPSAEGQARMAAALEPIVCRVLGDRRHGE